MKRQPNKTEFCRKGREHFAHKQEEDCNIIVINRADQRVQNVPGPTYDLSLANERFYADICSMVTITEKAKSKILDIMQAESYDASYFVRVGVESGGCSGLNYKLSFDNEERKGDQIFEADGIRMCLDIKSYLYLAGTELDYSTGLTGKGFEFHNPNASRTCACGESFAV